MKKLQKTLALLLIVVTLIGCMGISASAANTVYGAATVDATQLNIRTGPGQSYDVISMIGNSAIVVILERTNSEWYYINYLGTKGYVSTDFLKDILAAENFSATGTIKGDSVFIRTGPSTNENTITTYSTGKTMSVIGVNNGWYKVKVDGHTGYVRSDFMEITGGYTNSSGTSSGSSSFSNGASAARAAVAPSETGNELVDFALGYLGYNYKYGGKSPSTGFDCSGFVSYVYSNFGVSLTRSSSGQYKNDGTTVSKEELAPGDLLFFSNSSTSGVGHVGIYMGDNEFVHSSTTNVGVVVSRLDSTYYIRHWIGAKRISF